MSNLNKVFLVGRLTRDPELRYTPNGKPVCDFTIAINKIYEKDKKQVKETVFVDVTVWNKSAEATAEYMKKGKTILIEGELRMDEWKSKEGEKRSKMRVTAKTVQFLSSKEPQDQAPESDDESSPIAVEPDEPELKQQELTEKVCH